MAGRIKKSLDHAKDVSKNVEKLAAGSVKNAPKVAERASTSEKNPKNPLNRANLNKDLGSQQQISEKGKIIAGDGSRRSFKGAEKAAEKYGGEPKDWVKMTSSKHKPVDGKAFETHWLENIKTGERVEFKTKILE